MDKLQLKYRFEKKSLIIDTFINGEQILSDYPINIYCLEESLKKSGEYYLFTCSCGDPGCAGIHELHKVLVKDNSIIWSILKPEFLYFEFDKEQITEEIETLIDTLIDLKPFHKWENYHYGITKITHFLLEDIDEE